MKIVYTNESNILVNIARNLLVNKGLSVSVRNEHSSTGGHSLLANMELWVNHDSDYPKAMEMLSAFESDSCTEEWFCSKCNEKNDAAFDICWSCRS